MAEEFINSSQAHNLMVRAGIDISYPTAIKRMMEAGVAEQPTGYRGGVLVDVGKLHVWLKTLPGVKGSKIDAEIRNLRKEKA
jgi:hypothetical protein